MTQPIGTATMTPDGTIVLNLRAEGDDGTVGNALLKYQKGDAQYDDVIEHVGGLTPGECKLVQPWG